ncbi:MAG: carboxypeptidase-like regulatory domain-containing protein [Bacteroidia bacterium]|nr:carboxypeptidase-like regulatory domain-containing protein [Bacteroidia bacterium]
MKKNFWILIILLLCSIAGFTQKKTDAMLFGDVKSAVSKEHIPYATIMVKGTNMGTSADGTGHYKLANLPVGKCIIVSQALGYKSQEKEVIMEKDKAVELFFELDEDVLNLEQVVVS